jgi:hypothetical protein
MNAKQALKAASKRIEELEHFNRMSRATVVSLYKALDAVFSGGNLCELCEDYEECQLEAKKQGKGCPEWSHKSIDPSEVPEAENGPIEGLMGGTDEG